MTPDVPQRPHFYGAPERLPDAFTVTKVKLWRTLTTRCEVWTHVFGWELRLMMDGRGLQMSRVVRDADDLTSTVEEWRTALTEVGWR